MKTITANSNEIRPRKDICIKALCVEIILECVFILISIFIDLASLFFVFIMPIIILYTYMDLKNTSVVYDQNGITITIFTNKHFFYSWDDVIGVEDTYADPHLFRGPTKLEQRRILKIGVRNHKGKIEYLNYLFSHFSGTYQFLNYYECIQSDKKE